MNVTCRAGELAAALTRGARIVSPRFTSFIFQNVLLEAGLTGLQLTTMNAMLHVTSTVDASVEQAGCTTVPAKRIAEFVALLPDDSTVALALERSGTSLHVTCDSHDASFATLPPEEFPRSPLDAPTGLTIDGGVLAGALEQVLYAVAPDDTRPVLSGVLVQVGEGPLGKLVTLAAADGFRLAVRTLRYSGKEASWPSWLVPAATLREVHHALSSARGEACRMGSVAAGTGQHLVIEVGPVRFASRLIDGQFPDFLRIAGWKPEDTVSRVECDRAELLAAVRLATLFDEQHDRRVWLVASTGSPLVVDATNDELGAYRTDLAADIDGEVESVFNSRYLKEVLEHADAERVSCEVNGQRARLEPVGELASGGSYQCVVMALHGTRPHTNSERST